jgi:riboflavin synthase
MFTGIVTDRGRVRAVEQRGDRRLTIACRFPASALGVGASIACSGACLTVVQSGEGWFAVDVSNETLAKTTLGEWGVGTEVNLEPSLKAGQELGGHFVLGHVDATAAVIARRPDGDSLRFTFEAPAALERFIAPKGSIALDGVSLTVNEVDGARFGVNIIPHTGAVTTFERRRPGERVNVEVDMIARYLARLVEKP